MLQKTYGIYSGNTDDCQLIIEAGKNHLACWCTKNNENKLLDFEFFLCDTQAEPCFNDVLNEAKSQSKLLNTTAPGAKFIWNTNEVICVPNEVAGKDQFAWQNFDLLFGASNGEIFSEPYKQYLITTRIERDLQDGLQHYFPGATFHTQYGSVLAGLDHKYVDGGDKSYLYFYPNYFAFIVFKDGRLQLIQTKAYNTPEDVLYFILSVFKQYEIAVSTEVLTGGFIEERSKLYETLYLYLAGLKLEQVDETQLDSEGFKEYSSHYFLPYANYLL